MLMIFELVISKVNLQLKIFMILVSPKWKIVSADFLLWQKTVKATYSDGILKIYLPYPRKWNLNFFFLVENTVRILILVVRVHYLDALFAKIKL